MNIYNVTSTQKPNAVIEVEAENLSDAMRKGAERLGVAFSTAYALEVKKCL
jgi:hypothetical protein